jgi:hypothetical protein
MANSQQSCELWGVDVILVVLLHPPEVRDKRSPSGLQPKSATVGQLFHDPFGPARLGHLPGKMCSNRPVGVNERDIDGHIRFGGAVWPPLLAAFVGQLPARDRANQVPRYRSPKTHGNVNFMLRAKVLIKNKGSGIHATALERFEISNLTDFHFDISNFHQSGSNFHFCWQRTHSIEK